MEKHWCLLAGIIAFSLIGIIVTGIGIGSFFFMKTIVNRILNNELILEKGTLGYENWVRPPAEVYTAFYVWDIVNSDELLANPSARPHLVERGPFVWTEERDKGDLVENNNGSISFRQINKWTRFERSMSINDSNMEITTINFPLYVMASIVELLPLDPLVEDIIIPLVWQLLEQPFFMRISVNQFLWGRYSQILDLIITTIEEELNITLPLDPYIGLFKTKNNTNDGMFNVFTGRSDINLINMVNTWRYEKYLPFWKTQYANKINGTDGLMFHSGVTANEKLKVFSSEMCHSITFDYNDTFMHHGVEVLRFKGSPGLFEDPRRETIDGILNRASCLPDGTIKDCERNQQFGGVHDISPCMMGVPIRLSNPHFLMANDYYQKAIDGMKPDPNIHMTTIAVEPVTGRSLIIMRRVQINFWVHPLRTVWATHNFNPNGTTFPLMWYQEYAIVNESIVQTVVKDKALTPIHLATRVLPPVVLGVGALLFAIGVAFVIALVIVKRKESSFQDGGAREVEMRQMDQSKL